MKNEIDLSNEDIERGMLATRHMIEGAETSIKESKLLINSAAAALLLWGNTLTDEQRAQILNGEITEKNGDKLLSFITTLMVLLNAGISATTVYQFMSLEETEDKKTDEFIRFILKSNAFFANGLLESFKTRIKEINKIFSDFTDPKLESFIQAELQKGKYNSRDLDDLTITEALELLQAAKAARENEYGKATIKKTRQIDYPLDKINSYVWNLLENDTAGQIEFSMAKTGSKQDVPVYYAIDFDDLSKDITITKRLLPFDKRVYIAVAALFNAGNNVITLTQIYKHMGYTGKPGRSDLEKINKSILKMTSARIYINNEAEANTYKNYNKIIYRGSLLPLETGEIYNVQGALTNAAIHIFREPPLISFARQRKQITTVDIKLLQSPVNKTDANLQIDDYLIERISKAKHGKAKKCRILFKTLYTRAGVGAKKQQQRAPKKICGYLDYYKQCGFIEHYSQQPDGVTIYL